MNFSVTDFFRKLRIWSHFTEKIFNGKLHSLCSDSSTSVRVVVGSFMDSLAKKFESVTAQKFFIKDLFSKYDQMQNDQNVFCNEIYIEIHTVLNWT